MLSHQPTNPLSHLENQFPHIAQALTEKWGTPDIDAYLSNLMMDNRGTRKGFPSEVAEELMLIDTILWELSDTRKRFLPTPDNSGFSFGE